MKAITEDYVSYEIAKLLKEKGFDECPLFRYDDCGELWVQGGYNKTIKWHFPAPTLQMAMDWLREDHNLWIDIEPLTNYKWTWGIWLMNDPKFKMGESSQVISTYKEAVEAAVKYTLENLI